MAIGEMQLPRFSCRTETGLLALVDGIVVVFFLPGGHDKRSDMIQAALDRYLSLFGMPDRLGIVDEEGLPVLLGRDDVLRRVGSTLRSGTSEMQLSVVDNPSGASSYSMTYLSLDSNARTLPDGPEVVSGLKFTFPTDCGGDDALIRIFDLANELAGMLPFSSGYVAPAFLFHEGVGESAAFKIIRGLSKRFLCHDIPTLLVDSFSVGRGPKGAYWGNFFSPELVKELGGKDRFTELARAEDMRVRTDAGGVVSLWVEPIPQSGDVNRRADLSGYAALYKLLSSSIAAPALAYLEFDDEGMREWYERFAAHSRPRSKGLV